MFKRICVVLFCLLVTRAMATETVNFVQVPSQAFSGLASYQADVVGGFNLGLLDWSGEASPINDATFGSELRVDISGPLGTISNLQLGTGTTFPPNTPFSGSSAALFNSGDPNGTWTFDFYESFDDGSDGSPDAIWETIDFTFNTAPPIPAPRIFYGSNNLPAAGQDTGDELITYNFYNPAGYAVVGVFTDAATGAPVNNVSGLDWCGTAGQSPLIASTGFGGSDGPQPVYQVDPTNAESTFIANSLGVADLAFRAADNTMYGTDADGNLYRDTNSDCVPDELVGAYNLPSPVEVGLAFDGAGNLLVHDISSEVIYKGSGADPSTLSALVNIPYDSEFSQGLYADGTTGYHAALNNSALTSESWDFDTNVGTPSYTFWGAFPDAGGLPAVEVGDLTPVPEPAASSLLLALGLLGTLGIRRR